MTDVRTFFSYLLAVRNRTTVVADVILSASEAGAKDPTCAECLDVVDGNTPGACSEETFSAASLVHNVLQRAFALLEITGVRTFFSYLLAMRNRCGAQSDPPLLTMSS
jgi:hypothetical protein